jgi:hypothetical protein
MISQNHHMACDVLEDRSQFKKANAYKVFFSPHLFGRIKKVVLGG